MDSNKIIRRYGILKTNAYEQYSADMCELFEDFDGVVCSEIEPESAQEAP